MATVYININISTLFPIEDLQDDLKSAIKSVQKNGYAVITQNNRPAYAILRFPSADMNNGKLLYDADDDSGNDENTAEQSGERTASEHFGSDGVRCEYIIDSDIRKPLSKYLAKLQKENPTKLRKKGNWWDGDE